jgi:CRP-like cAMP-binding protein
MVVPTFSSSFSKSVIEQFFSCHSTLPLYRDSLWRIEQGAVRTVTWDEEGTIRTLGYWGTADVVGRPLSRLNIYEIQCLTDVRASLLSYALWSQAVETITYIQQIQQTEEFLSITSCNQAKQKLWLFLVFLAQKFGRNVERGRWIGLKLTHQQLGEGVNLSRVTVTILLGEFEAEGKLIRLPQKQLILPYSQGRFLN